MNHRCTMSILKQCYKFTSETSNKFWNVEVNKSDYKTSWGRIGTNGQSLNKEFPTNESAKKAAIKKINEKTRKGYKQVPCI